MRGRCEVRSPICLRGRESGTSFILFSLIFALATLNARCRRLGREGLLISESLAEERGGSTRLRGRPARPW